jgi:hypothetical protein
MMLSEFDALEFIIDDSGGGMNSATDGTDRFARTMPMNRGRVSQSRGSGDPRTRGSITRPLHPGRQ